MKSNYSNNVNELSDINYKIEEVTDEFTVLRNICENDYAGDKIIAEKDEKVGKYLESKVAILTRYKLRIEEETSKKYVKK